MLSPFPHKGFLSYNLQKCSSCKLACAAFVRSSGLLLQESNKFSEAHHYYKLAIGSRPTLACKYSSSFSPPPSFFIDNLQPLVVVAVLCPGNSEHRLWLCEARVIGGKGQWVYNRIRHSTQLSDQLPEPTRINTSSCTMMSFIMNSGRDTLISSLPSYIHNIFSSRSVFSSLSLPPRCSYILLQ